MPATPFLPRPRAQARTGEPAPDSRARPAARTTLAALATLALAALALGACASNEDKFAPACPSLALLPDAADLTRFDGKGLDVTNLIVRASITGVPAKCGPADPDTIRATLHVNADFRHGPANRGNVAPIRYFIALTKAGAVLSEQDFAFVPQFPPNVDRATVHGDDIELLLPVSKKQAADVYKIFVGFRLTPEELAYNRAHPKL